MNSNTRRNLPWRSGLAALLLATGLAVAAETNLSKAVLFGGTTITTGGRNWSYLLWQPGDEALLSTKTLAIYRKSGDAASVQPYQRESVIGPAWDLRMVTAVLGRAQNVGEDLGALESALQENFRQVLPPGGTQLAEKVLFCVQASLDKEELRENLKLLARRHPGLGLVLGRAYVGELPAAGQVTYELREFDPASSTDLGVIGRVTLTAGQVVPLPQPDPPFKLLPLVREGAGDTTRKEARKRHLSVDLRWGTPDDLRVKSLLQFGFNVYRVEKAYAESKGLAPQTTAATLLAHMAAAPGQVARVNRLPVLPDGELTNADAWKAADTTTSFFTDDNDRFGGGTPFQDGQQFYYYIAARDVLGRDGELSLGTLVTVCGWMPPFPPEDLRVEPLYDYNTVTKTGHQHFRLRWLPAEPGEGIGAIAGYHVYRWQSVEQMQHFAPMVQSDGLIHAPVGDPVPVGTGRIAFVPHVGATLRYVYEDTGAKAPVTPTNAGQPWVYSVRAVDNGVCGPNISENSAPSVGHLPNLGLIDPPIGTVNVKRFTASLVAKPLQGSVIIPPEYPAGNVRYVIFQCTSTAAPLVESVEFYDASQHFVGSAPMNGQVASITVPVPIVNAAGGDKLWCRARLRVGITTAKEPSLAMPANVGSTMTIVPWELTVASVDVPAGADDHVVHHVGPGLDGKTIVGPEIDLMCGAEGKRYRLYRRVNEGPLTLIHQGKRLEENENVTLLDKNPPAHSARLCYYAQVDDLHGHFSPLALIKCLESRSGSLPQVQLKPITSTTTGVNAPAMRLDWVCPPHGVERFEVWLAKEASNPPAAAGNQLSANLRTNIPPYGSTGDFSIPMGAYETPRVAVIQVATGPSDKFTATIPIEENRNYLVAVRAVGPGPFVDVMEPTDPADAVEGRPAGEFSEMLLHRWVSASEPQPVVPQGDLAWPARPLAPVLPNSEGLEAKYDEVIPQSMSQVHVGPRVKIGEWGVLTHTTWGGARKSGSVLTSYLHGHVNPLDYVTKKYGLMGSNTTGMLGDFTDRVTPLPCALYRRRLPNGEIVQVTPLIEDIAYSHEPAGPAPENQPHTIIHDPWVMALLPRSGDELKGSLWIVDRHPVVKDAQYQYYVVFYNQTTHEVRAVIPTNTVTISPPP